jgi:hypothetical protein
MMEKEWLLQLKQPNNNPHQGEFARLFGECDECITVRKK